MKFQVMDLSTLLAPTDAPIMAEACAMQVVEFGAEWSLEPCSVEFLPKGKKLDDGAWPVLLVDRTEVLGAYGYHTDSPSGGPYAMVDVGECMAMGGTALVGSVAVSVTLSHEILECYLNPWLALWKLAPDGTEWSQEAADAVEDVTYSVSAAGQQVSVSDYVLPAFFGDPGTKFDRMGALSKPFSITPGGYTVIRRADGSVDRFPARRLRDSKYHEASRTAQLLAQGK